MLLSGTSINCATIPLNFWNWWVIFLTNRKTFSSCPPLLLASACVNQNAPAEGPRCKDVTILVKLAARLYFTPPARLWGPQRIWNVTFYPQPRPESKTCFLGGWKTKRNERPRSTPAYVFYAFLISIGWVLYYVLLFASSTATLTSVLTD